MGNILNSHVEKKISFNIENSLIVAHWIKNGNACIDLYLISKGSKMKKTYQVCQDDN